MRTPVATSFLASFAAVTMSCASENAVGPAPQTPQPKSSVPAVTAVIVTASAYTAVVGSTAKMTAEVSTKGVVGYRLEWSLSDGSNTATIDPETGVLTAAAPGFAYPRACATYTINGQSRTLCAETSIRIIAVATPTEIAALAFVRNGSIFYSSSGTSEPTLLIPSASRPSWSPDGDRIAFTRPSGNMLARWQLCIANRGGSDIKCATGPSDGVVLGKPSWSPDGSTVAFSVFNHECPNNQCGQLGGSFSSLSLLNTVTMHVETLNTPPVTSASWSPDGRKIAITLFGVGTFDRGALATVNSDGSDFRILAFSIGSYSVAEAAWSPDGGRLALVLQDENACPWYCDTAIGITNADGTQLKVLDKTRTCFGSDCNARDEYIWGAPEWVGNGNRVAYTVTKGGQCYLDDRVDCGTDIRIANISNGGIEVLMPAAGFPSAVPSPPSGSTSH